MNPPRSLAIGKEGGASRVEEGMAPESPCLLLLENQIDISLRD